MSHIRKAGPSKTAVVQKMLRRAGGATLAEITTVTAWQPHSVRAHLSGLRKTGEVLIKEARRNGETSYRLASEPGSVARKAKSRSSQRSDGTVLVGASAAV